MQSNVNFDLSYYQIANQILYDRLIHFIKEYDGDCVSTQVRLSVHSNLSRLVETVVAAFDACCFTQDHPRTTCYDSRIASITNGSVFVTLDDANEQNTDLWTVYDRAITINCYGEEKALKWISAFLKQHIEESKVPVVRWEFLGGDDRHSQQIKIKPAKTIHPEFYPWIGEDVYDYFNRYINSEASILVLLGETGTAKTSFIRSMIWACSLNTMFTYEEELLNSDSLFVDFIADERISLLVIEDADLFLTSREHDGNKIMSKFLNVSDGLASIDHKKMIFTANITEASRIDNALLRAGRCFDCQLFRRLTYAETCAAARVAGIPVPPKEQSYTLAELFAYGKGERQIAAPAAKVGFIG